MANDPPKTTPPSDGKATPAPTLIPVKTLMCFTGEKFTIPGKGGTGMAAINSDPPSVGRYFTVEYDPRARHHRICHFAPAGPDRDLKRAPTDVLMVPEGRVTWQPA